MNEFKILIMNYADAEHVPLFTAMLHRAYALMRQDGVFLKVFHDGSISNAEDMIAMLLQPGVLPVMAFDSTGDIAALAWLNGHEQRAARGHFVFFKRYWGRTKSIPLGRAIFTYLLGLQDDAGYLFDVLVGITPRNNPLAWRRAVDCGATLIGTIPHYCFMADTGETVDAVAVSVTRESLGGV